ncbi:hypothetical protein QNH20_10220 [Neobacillus sp. WH10]|uniref:hypothetical protein n=1 Tax=Neobacillus sp. WH10 TaxID=3047873 RepID=UPI0024C20209|nr:hypothetical protein [Neobacillus sp. WH10]WHY79484.1 hypothetical protein QNH20_10220 [Neobacillus sp. WH10]
MVNHIKAIHQFNINQIAGKHDTRNISIDCEGKVILLTSTKKRRKYHHSIFYDAEWGVKKIIIPPSKEPFHYAQPLGENWLLVNANAKNDTTHNAFVYDENLNLISYFHMGDGIEDVQTTKDGDIWTSYFDEGVFGNSIGASGLLCFDKKGVKIFDFVRFVQTPSNNEIPFIDDCYALNVYSNQAVYLYYYSDFPLLAIHNMTDYELFNHEPLKKTPIVGSHAFSIWKDNILFGHGYNHKGQIHLYSFQNKKIQSYLPVTEENDIINYDYSVGRKYKLFLVCKDDIYLVDIRDVI